MYQLAELGFSLLSWVLLIIMVGNLVRHSVAPGSSVTRLSDMVLPHYLEMSDVGNNGEKFVPASNLKSVAYQH